ncbi:MAG: DUF1127 domain-containing protein [Hoeflea sp.]|nr:DUF1127 domain-containing protein [Hoeflea sp.]
MRTSIAQTAIAAATALLRLRHTRRNAWMLHRLSDAQLRDIGLTRSDIGRVASGARELFSD